MDADQCAGEVQAVAGRLDADRGGVGLGHEDLPVTGLHGVGEGENRLVPGEAQVDRGGIDRQRGAGDRLGLGAVPFLDEGGQAALGPADGEVILVSLVLADGQTGRGAGRRGDLELGGGLVFRMLQPAAQAVWLSVAAMA